MTIFTTERLVVRRWAEGDAPALFALYGDRTVTRWLDRPVHTTLAQSQAACAAHRQRYARDDPGRGWWAIVERAGGAVVGNGGVHPIFEGRETEVAYQMVRRHWGRGYATEYARGAIRYGLTTLGLPRVVALTLPTNAASRRVMEKAGMRRIADVDFKGYWSVQYAADRARAGTV